MTTLIGLLSTNPKKDFLKLHIWRYISPSKYSQKYNIILKTLLFIDLAVLKNDSQYK